MDGERCECIASSLCLAAVLCRAGREGRSASAAMKESPRRLRDRRCSMHLECEPLTIMAPCDDIQRLTACLEPADKSDRLELSSKGTHRPPQRSKALYHQF